jgi:hypothetical protein
MSWGVVARRQARAREGGAWWVRVPLSAAPESLGSPAQAAPPPTCRPPGTYVHGLRTGHGSITPGAPLPPWVDGVPCRAPAAPMRAPPPPFDYQREERRIGQVGNPILRRASRPDRSGAISHQKEEEKRRTIHQSLLACSLAAPAIIRESPPNRRQQLGLTSQPCIVAGAAKKKTATPMHAGAGALEAFCAVPSDDAICRTRAKSRRHCRRCAFFSLFAD